MSPLRPCYDPPSRWCYVAAAVIIGLWMGLPILAFWLMKP